MATYLIDGSGYIFRAFYAVAPLTTKGGLHTNALFGFTKMLLKLIRDKKDEKLVVVFDAGKTTFRNELYDKYKANRSEAPQELIEQFPYFRKIAKALGLCVLELPGYEADDVIATLVDKVKDPVIVSGDKDLMQLVGNGTYIIDPMKDKEIREAEVIEKFGVPPDKVVEVLALMGDSSDNIPGVKGIGPKTASDLVLRYGGALEILEKVDEIENDKNIRSRAKVAQSLREHAEDLKISRVLVEVKRDSPLLINGKDINDLSASELEQEFSIKEPGSDLLELASELEFQSLLGERAKSAGARVDVKIVLRQEFDQFKSEILQSNIFSFDFETTSLNTLEAKIVGASFATAEKTFYIPVSHKDASNQISVEHLIDFLKELFIGRVAVAHNAKYDLGIMANYNFIPASQIVDTMIAAYLINPDERSYSLDICAERYLGTSTGSFEEVLGDKADFSEVAIADAAIYAGTDARVAFDLWSILNPKIEDLKLEIVFKNIEMPLVPILSEMERTGVLVDLDFLDGLNKEFSVELEAIEKTVYQLAGGEFNMNSPKQLSKVLFEDLGLPTKGLKKTKTGISTDSSVLEILAQAHELPASILRYRTLYKLKTTYLEALPKAVSPITGRIHTSFHQTVTGTGRLSSSDPNLQNIPIQSPEGKRIREGFIAPTGYVLLSADYSQIELRVLAHLSEDEALIEAFRRGEDIHAQTAKEILGLSRTPSTEERRLGKTMNFGIIYGMSAFRLGKELGIPVGEAQSYINSYFDRFSGVKKLFDSLLEQAQKENKVSTMFGRIRVLTSVEGSDRDKGFLQRVAVNAPIQGTAADLIKIAMKRVRDRISKENLPARLILQIHDELVLEAKEAEASRVGEFIALEMENAAELLVPLVASVGIGKNWNAAHG